MTQGEIAGLVGAYGWEEFFSKNPYMYSYVHKKNGRMNYYYTTGTLTVQDKNYNLTLNQKIKTLEEFESVISCG